MKIATAVLSALGLLLCAQLSTSDSLYETFLATHGWRAGHYVGACVLEAYRKFPMFGLNVWAGVCTCHTRTVQVAQVGGVNLGPYMRNFITCALSSTLPGVAVIGADIIHCVADKVTAHVSTGGK